MKKLMAVAALAICASGCVMTRNDSIASALTLDVTSPDTNFIDNSVKPTKKGVAKATGLICFCEGDASIKAAMENGDIKKIHHIDRKVRNILGLVAEYTTIVYGE